MLRATVPGPREDAPHLVGGHFAALPDNFHDLALSRGKIGKVGLLRGHRRLLLAMGLMATDCSQL